MGFRKIFPFHHDGPGVLKNAANPYFSAAFDPRQIRPANLKLWLDAKDQYTLYDADTGGSVVADGGTVGRWVDRSANLKNLIQATGANRPDWNAAGYIEFSGGASSAELLTSGQLVSQFLSTSNNTIFLVTRLLGSFTQNRQIFGDSSGLNFIGTQAGPVLRGFLFNGNSGQSSVTKSCAVDTDYIVQLRREGTTLALSLNGGTDSTVTTASTLTGLASSNFGAPGPSAGNFHQCRWYACAIWNTALTLNERNAVGRYFATRFGLTWTHQTA